MPSAACNLARLTHAPEITLIYESGTIATKPDVLPLSIGDGELCDTALTTVPVVEMFRYWLQGGRFSVGFLGGAQIDRFANLNTTVVGPYGKPKTRLPGGGGAPEISSACGEIFIIMRQSHAQLRREARLRHLVRPWRRRRSSHPAGACDQGPDQARDRSRDLRARSGDPGDDGHLDPSRRDPRCDQGQYRLGRALRRQRDRDAGADRRGSCPFCARCTPVPRAHTAMRPEGRNLAYENGAVLFAVVPAQARAHIAGTATRGAVGPRLCGDGTEDEERACT